MRKNVLSGELKKIEMENKRLDPERMKVEHQFKLETAREQRDKEMTSKMLEVLSNLAAKNK